MDNIDKKYSSTLQVNISIIGNAKDKKTFEAVINKFLWTRLSIEPSDCAIYHNDKKYYLQMVVEEGWDASHMPIITSELYDDDSDDDDSDDDLDF